MFQFQKYQINKSLLYNVIFVCNNLTFGKFGLKQPSEHSGIEQ